MRERLAIQDFCQTCDKLVKEKDEWQKEFEIRYRWGEVVGCDRKCLTKDRQSLLPIEPPILPPE